MHRVSLAALALVAACLAGCNQKVEGVLEPAAVQPPPSERGAGVPAGKEQPATAVDREVRPRRGLSVPAR